MPDTCIFCTILSKSIDILYESPTLFIIADINPLSTGHLLVIPKKHCSFLHELPDDYLSDILPVIKRVVNLLNYEKYNILQNNGHIQSVLHVHFHIVPFVDKINSIKVKWDVVEQDLNEFRVKIKKIKEKLEML